MLSESEQKNQVTRQCSQKLPFSFYKSLIASSMNFRNKSLKYFTLLFFLIVLGGCSVWENFTTYFNLYYNTSKLFNDTEEEIMSQKRDLFSNDPLTLPGNSRTSLVKVIEKSSNLLQFNPTSSYVDETLIILGKAFFYQGNYQKSIRKFEELLATKTDDEEKILVSNLWIAKSQFALKENTQALTLIEQVRTKSIEEGYDTVIKDSFVEEIKYYLREKNYPEAIKLSNEFAEVYDDSEVRARVYYELGKMYTLTGDNENAIIAFEKSLDNSPDFDLEISATIKYADALREAGQYEKALSIFEDIRDKDKFKNSINEIDFEIGRTLVGLGRYNQAYNQFKLVDSLYKSTTFASAANFEMAELYRTRFANYDSASIFYSKALASNPPLEYQDKVKSSNQLFIKYSKLRKGINGVKRQLFYTENPEIFNRDSTNYVADSLKILNAYLEKQEFQDLWKNININTQKVDSTKIRDSLLIRDTLVVRDSLLKVDSLINLGQYNTTDTTGLRQKIFKELAQNRFIQQKLDQQKNLAQLQKTNQLRLDTVKFKRNPPQRLKISTDSAKTILSKNSLELGNLFLTELNVPDSAYNLYTDVLNEYKSEVYKPDALFALGSYYLTVDNKQKSDSLFKIIYDNYKDKSIVNAAASRLNLPLIDFKFDPAKEQYAVAESLMLQGNFNQSLSKLDSIYKEYPKSPFASQSLYASGWILENNLSMPDSAAAVYEELIKEYPTSIYIKNINPKLTYYKQEKAKIQKAIQDSIAQQQVLHSDSTLVAVNQSGENLSVKEKEVVSSGNENAEDPDIKLNVAHLTNGNNQKKLEPLWDPRKHFQ